MRRLPYIPHRLRSRKELSEFLDAGIVHGERINFPQLKLYLTGIGPSGVGLPGRPMTEKGRAYGLRYVASRDDKTVDTIDNRTGVQVKTRRKGFPYTLAWHDLYFPSDYPFLKEYLSFERVFCDCAIFMIDHPD